MNLANLFTLLACGELSNLAMAEAGTIATASRGKITRYANDALLKLYGRFLLKEKEIRVELQEHITFYHLVPRFAVTYEPEGPSDTEATRYLLDLPGEPFLGDVIKILRVYDEHGCVVPLNDDNRVNSVFTPQTNALQVPCPIQDKVLNVAYQAKHPQLQCVLEEVIELPDILVEAFTAFIAYKVFSHMNTQDSTAKAQEHLAIYESVCGSVAEMDLVSASTSTTNGRFYLRGWV